MNCENMISIDQLSAHYQIEMSFFNDLHDFGLIEIHTLEQTNYVQMIN